MRNLSNNKRLNRTLINNNNVSCLLGSPNSSTLAGAISRVLKPASYSMNLTSKLHTGRPFFHKSICVNS